MKIEIDFSVSELAISELKKFMDEGSVVRVSAQRSGCSGNVYGLGIETVEDVKSEDLVEDFEDLKLVTDKSSAMLLDGVILDWHNTQENQGFKFTNKIPKPSCCRKQGGCS